MNSEIDDISVMTQSGQFDSTQSTNYLIFLYYTETLQSTFSPYFTIAFYQQNENLLYQNIKDKKIFYFFFFHNFNISSSMSN